MSSQEDIFATQETKKRKVQYEFVVLCDQDEDVPEPFSMYPTSMFSPREINRKWLDSILDDSSRLKRLSTLDQIQDKNLCLFGKIESGEIFFLRETVSCYYYFFN